jgi:hypothetical protein
MINQRLFDHYGIDTTKNLELGIVCARPYDTVLIDKQGSCYACECTSWLPQSIGNLQLRSLTEIVGSDMHQHLRGSVNDRSYRYCNEKQCSYLKAQCITPVTDQHIKHLRLAIDESCNLKCPSCRKRLIFHKEGPAYKLGIRLADKINEWLYSYDRPIRVHLGSDGDPFASHVYRHFMEHTPKRDNIKYSILTNALMFKEFHATVPHVVNNLQELGVSIDGASRETYEKLRLGGKWEKIIEGLECISEVKKRHGFRVVLQMVVQQDNWHEIGKMLELGHKYGVDGVYFNRIEDWDTNIDFTLQTFTQLEDFKNLMKQVSADPLSWDNVTTSI